MAKAGFPSTYVFTSDGLKHGDDWFTYQSEAESTLKTYETTHHRDQFTNIIRTLWGKMDAQVRRKAEVLPVSSSGFLCIDHSMKGTTPCFETVLTRKVFNDGSDFSASIDQWERH